MPHIVRYGCAGIAAIIIAALTSVGLFAVVAGGLPLGGPPARPVAGGAQVLVTIQAAQTTATPPPAATSTPMPGTISAVLTAPVAYAAGAPPTAPTTAAPTVAQASPVPLAASPAAATGNTSPRPSNGQSASHEGVTAEILDVERGWQPTDSSGAPIRVREGHELVAVQVRLANDASEQRYVADADLTLVADDGSRFAARLLPPLREPRLLTMPILPGDSVRGWLTFEVPLGLATRRLQWSPTRPDRPRAESTFVLGLPR